MASNTPLHQGMLVSWNDERGFGFIRPEGGQSEVFVHMSAFSDRSKRPQAGDTISYTLTSGRDGKSRAAQAQITAIGMRNDPAIRARPRPAASSWFPLLGLVLLLVVPVLGLLDLARTIDSLLPLLIYPLLSLISFILYADDKGRAQRSMRRTPETTLHLWDGLGGWPGGYLAQYFLRHKNRKGRFLLIFRLIIVLHQLIWASWLLTGDRLLAALGI
ncbi:MAG: DUF1294 domain-containing protein [Oscillochloris sp.]|nr:DUF1294 domain-containing protein [Oscillochloris sp.]